MHLQIKFYIQYNGRPDKSNFQKTIFFKLYAGRYTLNSMTRARVPQVFQSGTILLIFNMLNILYIFSIYVMYIKTI